MTSIENKKEELRGLFARKTVPVEKLTIENNEIHVWYEKGGVDPTLVVQLVERNTSLAYLGEDETMEENIYCLKFS
jgi:hypothetical protein